MERCFYKNNWLKEATIVGPQSTSSSVLSNDSRILKSKNKNENCYLVNRHQRALKATKSCSYVVSTRFTNRSLQTAFTVIIWKISTIREFYFIYSSTKNSVSLYSVFMYIVQFDIATNQCFTMILCSILHLVIAIT